MVATVPAGAPIRRARARRCRRPRSPSAVGAPRACHVGHLPGLRLLRHADPVPDQRPRPLRRSRGIRVGDAVIPATSRHIDDELDVALLRGRGTPAATPLPPGRAGRAGRRLRRRRRRARRTRRVGDRRGRSVTLPLTAIWGVLHVEANARSARATAAARCSTTARRVVGVVSKRRGGAAGSRWALALPIDYIADWLPTDVAVEGPGLAVAGHRRRTQRRRGPRALPGARCAPAAARRALHAMTRRSRRARRRTTCSCSWWPRPATRGRAALGR